MITLLAGALAGGVIALSACGDGDSEASSARDAVPASAIVYVEATVRPEGDLRERLDALLARFGDLDLGGLISSAIDSAAAQQGAEFTYADDVEPWLGSEAEIFFSDPELESGAVVLESTDDDAAEAAVEKALGGQQTAVGTFEDHEYTTYDDGESAVAVSDGLLLVGTVSGLEAAFTTLDGGDKLADDEAFNEAIDGSSLDESLGALYVDVEALVDASSEIEPRERQILEALAPQLLTTPVVATAGLGDDTAEIDASYGSFGSLGSLGYAGGTSSLLGELPSDVWGATASADLGQSYGELLDAVASSGIEGASPAELELFERQVEQVTDTSLDEVLASFGDVAFFVGPGRGDSLEGGALIEVRDQQTMSKLLLGAERSLSRNGARLVPVELAGAQGFASTAAGGVEPVYFLAGGDRAVIAYGAHAAKSALSPSETLSASPDFQSAAANFDGDLAIGTFVELGTAIAALARYGDVNPVELALVSPYLEALGYAAAASSDDGTVGRSRLVLGFD